MGRSTLPAIAAPTVGNEAALERVSLGATLGAHARSGLHNPAHGAPSDAIERLQGVVSQGDGASFHPRSVAKSHSVLSISSYLWKVLPSVGAWYSYKAIF